MECYLDNSATTRCSGRAAEMVMKLLREDYGNPSSLHGKGFTAEKYITEARRIIAGTLKASEKEIIFTSGGTESNNMAIFGALDANRRVGKHVITSPVEHSSVAMVMNELENRGYEITRLSVDAFGRISPEELKASLREDTVLVSLMQINNEIGAVEPVREAGKIIHDFNPAILFHVDGVQGYGKQLLYPGKCGLDLYSVSGHKLHGPKGSGFLYVREKVKIHPILLGGGQQWGFRSGTENVPAIAGLGEAVRELFSEWDQKMEQMYENKAYFVRKLLEIDGVSVNGIPGVKGEHPTIGEGAWDEGIRSSAPHIVSVSVKNVRAEVLLHALEDRGIYVSAGSACSSNRPAVSPTLQAIGLDRSLLDSTVRFSFCVETTREQLDYALDAMRELVPQLGRFVRH